MKFSKNRKLQFIGSFILVVISTTIYSQDIKDVDGNVYKTIKHGLQVWTGSNLNVSHFRNGDVIPEAKTSEEWINAGKNGKPAWCYYDNDPANKEKHGKLYNWFAINDPRGLAPAGWHIPQNSDWTLLVKNLFGVDLAGTKLKSKTAWKSKKGTDDIGFSAIPSGLRDAEGNFSDLGVIGQWWSNSAPVEINPSSKIFSFWLSDNYIEVRFIQSDKGSGLSVRCVRD